ncbi:HCaRG protein [Trichomonas vaginalis G3]|uniref:COMM domain-containing protein 6 n=1 Tax=Trichomonas vaginalis (strain ATCC PRA-98 / G3) TaxID=412133 RepID=A2DNF6_TRIV3|nr:COMM domain-containing protein 4-8 family member family [Trichomonas vaginalis G3]EAY18144.1 HCaRG protein [Trichomonas vaginalis G3]KAI5492421.1 COMM domain-containing protein 4-8 family member family [Trichomonas vaginalis G3]|eukprot:XP_001579130.1 HCaRG protein [Trichomonas vaginalis G3]
MLSQQEIKDNMVRFESISTEEAAQLAGVVLDHIQLKSNLSQMLAGLEFSDTSTKQILADTILSFINRLLQSRTATSDCSPLLKQAGLNDEYSEVISKVISNRLDTVVKDLAEKSSGDKLQDLEWRFGLTAASSTGAGTPFIQMRLQFENIQPVSIEMGMTEFYEFAADIKRIQAQMSNTLNI